MQSHCDLHLKDVVSLVSGPSATPCYYMLKHDPLVYCRFEMISVTSRQLSGTSRWSPPCWFFSPKQPKTHIKWCEIVILSAVDNKVKFKGAFKRGKKWFLQWLYLPPALTEVWLNCFSLYLDPINNKNTIIGFATPHPPQHQCRSARSLSPMPERSQMTNEAPCVKDEFQSTTPVPPTKWKDWLPPIAYLKCLIPPLRNLFTWIRDN